MSPTAIDPQLQNSSNRRRSTRDDSDDGEESSLSDLGLDLVDRSQHERPRRKKQRKSTPPSEADLAINHLLKQCERATRLQHLLTFSDEQLKSVVQKILGRNAQNAQLLAKAEVNAATNFANWKSRSLSHMKEFVNGVVEKERLVAQADDYETLCDWFYEKYQVDNFERVFKFLKGLIKIEASSEAGQEYCRNIFANLAGKVKLVLDWKKRNGPAEDKHNEDSLHTFYQAMAMSKLYNGIDKKHFHIVPVEKKKSAKRTAREAFKPDELQGFKVRGTALQALTPPDT